MPFDNTLRRPTVTVLPPTPPERGGGPQRIRIEIEIVRRATRPPRRSSALWWLLLFLMLAMAAHAQPTSWQSYRQGFTRQYQGTDAQGGQWTGQSYRNGDGSMQFDASGPRGEARHCRSYKLGFTTHTECD